MDILIIGNGGREDALAKSLLKSDKIENIYISPQVGFSHDQIKSINIDVSNFNRLLLNLTFILSTSSFILSWTLDFFL